LAAAAAVGAAALAACGSGSGGPDRPGATGHHGTTGSLTIALQQDIAFSPLYIIEQEHWLDQVLPGVKVSWDVLDSGAAIQTSMISDKVNVGALGVTPFLLGQAKGVPWKLLSSLSESDMSLVVKRKIATFRDIKAGDRIAVVSPTSIEAIALEKMAQVHLGTATALNPDLVTMTQPEAAQAFVAGSIAGVVAVEPYTQQEIKAGGHVLDTSFQEFGKSTLDSVVVNTSYYQAHAAICRTLFAQIKRAITLLTTQPSRAAEILAAYYRGAEPAATLRADITNSSQTWTTVPTGYLRYAAFMKRAGLLGAVPPSMKGLEEPTLAATPGS
jgi:NitT/TauT family transport system substrate-binding protein